MELKLDAGIGQVASAISNIADKIWPNAADRDLAKLKIMELQQSGELQVLAIESGLMKSQADINLEDAKSNDKYQSRWRPSFGWVCVIGYAYHYIFRPFLMDIATFFDHPIILTEINISALETLTLGILGLSTIRGVEKVATIVSNVKIGKSK